MPELIQPKATMQSHLLNSLEMQWNLFQHLYLMKHQCGKTTKMKWQDFVDCANE